MRAAIGALRLKGVKKIILAVPVSASDAFAELSRLVDEAIVLEKTLSFSALGQFYEEFNQTSDEEVVKFLV
jgi:predicted phosphoribosyltransferase